MAINVKQFAEELSIDPAKLLDQLSAAGVTKKSIRDELTEDDKGLLLAHLKRMHGKDSQQKLTLTRRETSQIKTKSGSAAVQVEVRKKRVVVRREPEPPTVSVPEEEPKKGGPVGEPVVEPQPDEPKVPEKTSNQKKTKSGSSKVQAHVAESEVSPSVDGQEDGKETEAHIEQTDVEKPAKKTKGSTTKRATKSTKKDEAADVDPTIVEVSSSSAADVSSDKESTPRKSSSTTTKRATKKNKADEEHKADVADVTPTKDPSGRTSILSEEELGLRRAEEERQRVFREHQEALLREKQERESRRSAAKQRKLEVTSTTEKPSAGVAATPSQTLSLSSHRGEPDASNKKAEDSGDGKRGEKKGSKKSGDKDRTRQQDVRRTSGRSSGRNRDDGSGGKKTGKQRQAAASAHAFQVPIEPIVREVFVPETITVADLAHKMAVKAAELIKILMKMGMMVTINQVLDQETAMIVVEEMGHVAKAAESNDPESFLDQNENHQVTLSARPPVVTVMGHVDHGKTSLLDYIRRTKVVSGEAGGITQHIGAYHVDTEKGGITFLDTPGHEAFTAMRARGAKATDIVVLVVAADDGVMPQTIEAIHHAQAAGVPIVVAVNKTDKADANPERIRQELSQHEVVPEAWGGDIMFVDVSAKTGQGVDQLLESILLQAEVMELKAATLTLAKGVVVESRLDKGRGAVVTLLVQSGTLRRGDILLSGSAFGRIKAMSDEHGCPIQEAGPSTPVEVLGLSDVPAAGEDAIVLLDERKAREIALFRQGKFRDLRLAKQQTAKLENMFSHMTDGEVKTFAVIVKSDVQGSHEALNHSLQKLSTDEVRVHVLHAGVGGITESDVNLAIASQAVIIGFNTRVDAQARKLADQNGVQIRYYNIIYEVVDDIKAALSGMLSPERKEHILGYVEVRQVFHVSKIGAVAGCMVKDGLVKRSASVRLLRDHVVIHTGELESLKRFKDDVKEVKSGYECGLVLKNFNDIQEGDQLEAFEVIEVARKLQ